YSLLMLTNIIYNHVSSRRGNFQAPSMKLAPSHFSDDRNHGCHGMSALNPAIAVGANSQLHSQALMIDA
ncbi:MAG: hypothetical protein KAS38_21840, partial [Anaerolineales bacterium]|nr:hypothetical protein [Anaerolineales bacterium]